MLGASGFSGQDYGNHVLGFRAFRVCGFRELRRTARCVGWPATLQERLCRQEKIEGV